MNKKNQKSIFYIDASKENIHEASLKTLRQGQPCQLPNVQSSYSHNENKCVIGQMMSDQDAKDLQDYVTENKLVGNIGSLVRSGHVCLVNQEVDLDDLIELQDAHDYFSMTGRKISRSDDKSALTIDWWKKIINIQLREMDVNPISSNQMRIKRSA